MMKLNSEDKHFSHSKTVFKFLIVISATNEDIHMGLCLHSINKNAI